MFAMTSFRRVKSPRLLLLCAFVGLVLLFSLLKCVLRVAHFESYLDTHSISYTDFSPGYVEALNVSLSLGQPVQYKPTTAHSTRIPPIIHHIWFTGVSEEHPDQNEIPDNWKGAQKMCRENNPDYQIYMWTNREAENLLKTSYPWFIPTYESYPYAIQRVDALKYFLLFHYGGVYVDLDVSCRRPLDPLLDFDAWFPRTKPVGVSNDLMASRPGHPVFKRLVESMPSHNFNLWFTYLTVFWSTGPQYVNNILRDWVRKMPTDVDGALEDGSSISILPPMLYSEESPFFGHRAGNTWHRSDVAVLSWVWKRLWLILPVVYVGGFLVWKAARTAGHKGTGRSKISYSAV